MHSETYEMIQVPSDIVEGDGRYYLLRWVVLGETKQVNLLQEGMTVNVQTVAENPEEPIAIQLPSHFTYTIVEDEPIAGQASKGVSYKSAFIGEGQGAERVRIMVPEFVKVGDRIVVDTSEGKYVRRAGPED